MQCKKEEIGSLNDDIQSCTRVRIKIEIKIHTVVDGGTDRNDSLDKIIDECPENRLKDLVFLQNGYLDGFLEKKGLSDNTQSLLFFSVPALGVEPVDGVTSVNPEGLTAATGIHAQVRACPQ